MSKTTASRLNERSINMTRKDIEDALHYLEQLEHNPEEKERFNRSMKHHTERERKRKDGDILASFLDAIRIP